jgi:hypothetical protein
MKEKLEFIVGKNVLNGESSSNTVVKLAKVINYLEIQLRVVQKTSDEETKEYIDDVIKRAEDQLS